MDSFPAFFPLAGRTVVIVGAGEAAEAKARLFDGSPARVARLAGPQALDPAAYRGAALAFVADADSEFAEAAARAARQAGTPVNVVDRPALCDFFTPAVVDRGEVVAAVGSGGGSPMLAAMLRNDIEARIPPGAGRVAALFRQLQAQIREALPGADQRRAFLRGLIDGPAAQAAMAGDMDQARRLVDEALAGLRPDGSPPGRVSLVQAGGPADLLSLRAARALSQADALVLGPDIGADVAGLARRDARRLAADDGAVAAVSALAAQGLHVAWVVAGQVPPPLVSALRGAGVALVMLASAPDEAATL